MKHFTSDLAAVEEKEDNVRVGVLILRTWFWGILYHNYNKEPPK